jgi:membrane-associated PAP2 superfamily phosphatase
VNDLQYYSLHDNLLYDLLEVLLLLTLISLITSDNTAKTYVMKLSLAYYIVRGISVSNQIVHRVCTYSMILKEVVSLYVNNNSKVNCVFVDVSIRHLTVSNTVSCFSRY